MWEDIKWYLRFYKILQRREGGGVEEHKQNKIGHMSITAENERCMKFHHTLPLCMNKISHNQVTTLNVHN